MCRPFCWWRLCDIKKELIARALEIDCEKVGSTLSLTGSVALMLRSLACGCTHSSLQELSLNVSVTWVLCDRRNNAIENFVSVFSGIAKFCGQKPVDTTADERGHLFGDVAVRVCFLALSMKTIAVQGL